MAAGLELDDIKSSFQPNPWIYEYNVYIILHESSSNTARDECKILHTTHSSVTQYNYRDTTSSAEMIFTCYAYLITALHNLTVSSAANRCHYGKMTTS